MISQHQHTWICLSMLRAGDRSVILQSFSLGGNPSGAPNAAGSCVLVTQEIILLLICVN